MVRTRSDEKRREIIRVAAQAFQELGYDRTSMLTIAERMSGSKQTLYNHFGSKEDLLRAVLEADVSEVVELALKTFAAEKDLRKAFLALGKVYLSRQLAPLAISNFRNAATQPAESKLGEDFYRKNLCASWQRFAGVLKSLMAEGKLRRADPWLAAMHFKGLVLQDLLERVLLNAAESVEEKEMNSAAKHAADAFLKIYGPEELPVKGSPRK
jgi:AcrR family transcriptional regulator